METNALPVSVVMQRTPLANPWQSHQWRPAEVLIAPVTQESPPVCLRRDEADTRWLFSGFYIKLFTDEAEGYFLNISSPVPCWFIMYRLEEISGEEVAVPKFVTLSYHQASRLMDGGETVETVPAPPEIVERLQAFVADQYKPEPKKKRLKPSFEGGAAVQAMANAERGRNGS